MIHTIQGTLMMGPLLRQHFEIFERDGDDASRLWANSLPERQQAQLASEMMVFMVDSEGQEMIAHIREATEQMALHLGFTSN